MNRPLRAIAIDDEPAALKIIQSHAAKIPQLELEAVFLEATEGLAYLQAQEIDLAFVDVQMPDLLGTDLVSLARQRPTQFVFVTAYPDYALEGFNLNVLDYLLKPVNLVRFTEACQRAVANLQGDAAEKASFFVKDGYKWVRINLEEILYIRSDTNLLFIHEQQRVVNTRMTISQMMEKLPDERFLKVHRSYIVALEAVEKLEKHQLTVAGTTVPLASTYREEVERRLLRG